MQYKDKLKIAEFTDAIVKKHPEVLQRLQQDPADDTVDVDMHMSSIAARRLYQDHPGYFEMDLRDNGKFFIVCRVMSDYQAPYSGSTIVGAFSTGGENDEVCNIDENK